MKLRLVILVLFLLACGQAAPAALPTATPTDIFFGSESGVITEPFELKAGPLEIFFSHRGEGRFYAVLLDSADQRTLLIDQLGRLNQAETYTIPAAGSYRLDIFSQAKWTVRLRQ